MFNFVRNHAKIVMGILFLLVFPSFVFFGISNFSLTGMAAKVAKVDGQGITQTDWDNAVKQASDRARASNPTADIKLFDSPAFKYRVLQDLVRQRVMTAAATGERLIVSDAQLAQALRQDPTIASMLKPDGTIDSDRYQALAAQQGLTTAGLEASFRAQLSQQQALAGVAASSLSSQAIADVALRALQEQRQVRIAMFKPADYSAKLNPTDADLQAFYQAHLAQYQAPESAQVEYVVLDLDAVKRDITVNDADLRTYYDQNKATLGTVEKRRVSHILIAAPKDAPAADRAKAKARAEELLAQVRKAPDTFADVAKKDSQDDTSAAQGGDLGWFQDGKGIDPNIAKAASALVKAGDISGIVESDFGYHIVRLTELQPASVPPFEQVRASLEDKLRTQQAQAKFSEMAETFTNTVFTQSDSLKPAADALKLTIQTAQITRPSAPDVKGVLANPKFIEALFSTDAREKKNNTPATEVGPSQLASGRVVSYSPAHARPFAEVKDQVRAAYLADRGAQLARQSGEQQLKAWQANAASATGLADPITLSRQDTQKQHAALIEAVLRADPSKLPAFVGVDLGEFGYAIVQVQKVMPWAAPSKDQAAQNLTAYQQLWSQSEAQAYYEHLKERYKAQILVPEPTGAAALAPAQ